MFAGIAVKSVMKCLQCIFHCNDIVNSFVFQSTGRLLRCALQPSMRYWKISSRLAENRLSRSVLVKGTFVLHGSLQIYDGFLLLQELQRNWRCGNLNSCRIQIYVESSFYPLQLLLHLSLQMKFHYLIWFKPIILATIVKILHFQVWSKDDLNWHLNKSQTHFWNFEQDIDENFILF